MDKKLTDANGIKAIIALQKFAGITETKEQAKKGWRGMSLHEKRNTMAAYRLFCA